LKGHLYSDFILNKYTIFFMAGYSFFLALVLLFSGSEELTSSTIIFFFTLMLLIWLNCGIIGISQFSKGKVRQFAVTFPQGKNGYVLSKYIFCVLLASVLIICTGICLLSPGVGIKFGTFLTIMNIGFIFLWFELAFVLIFGENFGGSVLVVLFVGSIFLATAYILFGDLTFLTELTAEDVNAFFSWLGDNLAVYSTIGNIAVLAVTFPLSCRFVSLE